MLAAAPPASAAFHNSLEARQKEKFDRLHERHGRE
jgi:hypothetical protein